MKQLYLIVILGITSLNIFAQQQMHSAYSDSIDKKRLITAIGIGAGSYIGGITFLNYVWYKDQERVPFHFYDDSKGYLQMDKAGHAYGAYRESNAAYYALRRAGVDKKKALLYGGPIGFIFQAPIEIFDGLYEGWGFSWSDIIANTFGATLFMLQEAVLNEQVFLLKFSYSPSIYPTYHSHLGETHLERFFLDYNAHTYWLSGNLNKLTGGTKIPQWINIAFGYSANGMIYEFDNPTIYQGKPFPYLDRYRQYIFSFDIDFSKIPSKKKWVKYALRVANFLKVPFPAVEYNKIDGLRFRALYF